MKSLTEYAKTKLFGSLGKFMLEKSEQAKRNFITIHERPICAGQIKRETNDPISYPLSAIVIQGPIVTDYDFTLETIKLYKKNFRNIVIIVSTWDNEPKFRLDAIRLEGANIVTSPKPENAGPCNINLQIISTQRGISLAKKLGAKYVIKTRTDQRMYGLNIMQFLFDMVENFSITSPLKFIKKRLVGVSIGTQKYPLYHLSDLFMFGDIDDMIFYWNTEMVPTNIGAKTFVAEKYLFTSFLKRVGWPVTDTLEDSWRAITRYAMVADTETLDLYWLKYSRHREYRFRSYNHPLHELSFAEWFILYNRYKNI